MHTYFAKKIRRLVNWWWFDVTNKILLFKLDKCVFAFMTRFLHNLSTSSTLISDPLQSLSIFQCIAITLAYLSHAKTF